MCHQNLAVVINGEIGKTVSGVVDEALGSGVGRAMQRRTALPGCVDQAGEGSWHRRIMGVSQAQ
ncbi:MAG: hypothetical protein ACUVR3_07960 [Candidatus Roseilinea sp.]|uniref:hypothetical protein n=1 Tax=Candidatus Roseilinea sp. TaxID=2838777 RepID=UPI00404B1EE1